MNRNLMIAAMALVSFGARAELNVERDAERCRAGYKSHAPISRAIQMRENQWFELRVIGHNAEAKAVLAEAARLYAARDLEADGYCWKEMEAYRKYQSSRSPEKPAPEIRPAG